MGRAAVGGWVSTGSPSNTVSPGSAEAQVSWGGKVKYVLIVYFLCNARAKNYRNRTVYVKIIACQRWDVCLRHSVYIKPSMSMLCAANLQEGFLYNVPVLHFHVPQQVDLLWDMDTTCLYLLWYHFGPWSVLGPPKFWPMSIVAKRRLHGIRCHLVWR